jgi:hypothetical protein
MALHALFLREHNRLAAHYQAKDPAASDHLLFLQARRMVVAELQAITFSEYLPALLGPLPFLKESGGGGDDGDDGDEGADNEGGGDDRSPVPLEFSTAAFRFGHSQVGNTIERRGASGQYLPGLLPVFVRRTCFRPTHVV